MVPPAPNSISSGWALITNALRRSLIAPRLPAARGPLWTTPGRPSQRSDRVPAMDLQAAFDTLPGLTDRVAQRRMAEAVARALATERPLLVHAPTGVGKSLGYLVPVVAAGRRAIVATATKALQSQLVERDLPRLADAFGTTSALVMGRGNYLCLAGETRVMTSTGIRELRALAGGYHELLDGNGKWVRAEVRSFGV